MVERTQSLVLGIFALAWISLVVILLVSPTIYEEALELPAGRNPLADLAFVGAISVLIAFLSIGVFRRWTFCLILISFLIGGLARILASVLAFAGILPPAGPPWYVVFQAFLVQVGIGALMPMDYRRAGMWGRIPAQRSDAEVRIWRNE